MSASQSVRLPVDKLVVGLMVDIELSWSKHPFLFSKFKITSKADIAVIKQLGLTEVTVFPGQSSKPVEVVEEPAAKPEAIESTKVAENKWKAKNSKLEQADKFRKKRSKIAKKYKEHAAKVRKMTHELKTEPANAIHNAAELVESMAAEFDTDNDLLTSLVNLGAGQHTLYNHCINVTILSLSLASVRGIRGESLRLLARGAILHDVGKVELPGPILTKTTKLTAPEAAVYRQHSQIGRRLCELVEETPKEVLEIIELHHEYLDGSGFPHQKKSKELSELTKIVCIANTYDNLCNPRNPAETMTPKIALATMYSKYKGKLDHELVQCFISTLGVFPPGSVVQLNDGSIGLVICVDPHQMLKPEILLYHPDIPPLQALIVDLKEQSDLTIEKVLKAGEYPSRVYEYLGVEQRLGVMASAMPQ